MGTIIYIFAVYGLSSLLVEYDGPYMSLERLRNKFKNSPLHCVVCTAFWVAIALVVFPVFGAELYLLPLAAVGVAVVLEKL